MPSFTFEILVILLLIVANGLFAMAEIAVVSARKARLQQRADEGDAKALAALELANAPNRLLSTIQVGITLIGILTGAYGGATLAQELAGVLSRVPWLAGRSDGVALAIVVLGIGYLTLIIGELVPKRLALHSPERIAAAVARPMRLLSVAASPVVHFLGASTDLVLRLLRVRPSIEPPVTPEEIKVLIQQGTQAGVFEEAEQDIVQRVFRLGDRRVSVLMTPRTEIVWLDIEDSPDRVWHDISESCFSRFPVGQGSLDNVLGLVHVKDLLESCLAGKPLDLRASLQNPLVVSESTRALRALELFKESGTAIALVVDEYGSIQGLVTLQDILEAIVGDIPSIDEAVEPQAVQRDDGSWLIDGMLPVDEFKEMFRLGHLPGEDRGDYQTLGGFVMMHMARVPSAADHFDWGGLHFEVVDMDGNRVDKVLITPVPEEPAASD
jgi:putative hemolysin